MSYGIRSVIIFWVFIYLAIFCAGIMLVLQFQHFGLYPLVGPEKFAAYIARIIAPRFSQRSRRLLC